MDDVHVAVIPDGNRRYGRTEHDDAEQGHEDGTETAVDLVDWLDGFPQVGRLTLWGLSNANEEKRTDPELAHLNKLYRVYAEDMNKDDSRVHANDIRVEVVGDRDLLYDGSRAALEDLEADTAMYDGVELGLALGYDASWDVEQAVAAADDAYGDGTRYEEFLEMPEVDILM
ncbi:MAG: undecaprenyl diphosphate synthase family protein, partial [Candidatus Nanohaloarchaea archaeon]